jgi:hypothetical protein
MEHIVEAAICKIARPDPRYIFITIKFQSAIRFDTTEPLGLARLEREMFHG